MKPIRVVIVDIAGEATQADYQIVWAAAQPFINMLSSMVDKHAKNAGRPITATAFFTVFARMLAQHPEQDRAAIIAAIINEIGNFDPNEIEDDEADAELPGEHPLMGVTTQGNA